MTKLEERLVYTEKGWKSLLTGLIAIAFGAGCFWLASVRPGEENGWVPWVVGGMFSAIGIFSVFVRSRTVFNRKDRTWTDSWGLLSLNFSEKGSFDDLSKVVVEETVLRGRSRFYVWVKGKRGIRLLLEIEHDRAEAGRVADKLRLFLDLPGNVKKNE